MRIVKGTFRSIIDMQRQVERDLALPQHFTIHWSYSGLTGYWSVIVLDRHGQLRGDLATQVRPRFNSKIHVR